MEKEKRFYKILTIVLIIYTAIIYTIFILNNMFGFIPLGDFFLEIIAFSIYYAPIALAMCV